MMIRQACLLSFVAAAGLIAGESQPLVIPLRDSDPAATVPEVVTPSGGVAMVSRPEMMVHLPDPATASGLALVVCPGGSYREVGAFADGMRTVPGLVPKGVAVIVLKYRTRPPSANVVNDALADAKRAMRLVRSHAKEWRIDPNRIGTVGSSAGSHLVLNLATHWDLGDSTASDLVERESCRPDFVTLLCPWPNSESVEDFPISKDTPPMFVACAEDDKVAPIAFSEGIVAACQKSEVPVEFWVLERGGHTAFKQKNNPAFQWMERMEAWLKKTGFWKG